MTCPDLLLPHPADDGRGGAPRRGRDGGGKPHALRPRLATLTTLRAVSLPRRLRGKGGEGRLAFAALSAVLLLGAASPDPIERLPDPAQEARARHLFEGFRCVVCQNESIEDSQADLASDLRHIIRGQVAAGRSDADIRSFMVARYGEFILLKPSFSVGNAALWLAPLVVLLVGGGLFFARARKPLASEAALTSEEEAQVRRLLREDQT
jgi:cytochrome c-type biogenesis protein CcmH